MVLADGKPHSLSTFSDSQAVHSAFLKESKIKLVATQGATVTFHPLRMEIVPIQRQSSSDSFFRMVREER